MHWSLDIPFVYRFTARAVRAAMLVDDTAIRRAQGSVSYMSWAMTPARSCALRKETGMLVPGNSFLGAARNGSRVCSFPTVPEPAMALE